MAVVELVEKPAEANLSEQVDAIACKLYLFADRVESLADTISELIENAHISDPADTLWKNDLTRAMILAGVLVDIGKEAGPVGEQLEDLATKIKGGPAKGSPPPVHGDAAIIEAWETRRNACRQMNEGPLGSAEEPVEAHKARLSSIADKAEETIRSQVATTHKGVILQLLTAIAALNSDIDDDSVVTQGEVSWLLEHDKDLDWNERHIVAAMRSLQAMEENHGQS